MTKRTIPYAEFYITNVCNLTCEDCNRFNNLKFRGWQSWHDYADTYARWAELVDIGQPVILGGEPLLNPTILDWIVGLHKLWPNTGKQILTNGTYIDKIPNLFDICYENRTWIGISKHRDDDLLELESKIEKYLGGISVKNHSPTGRAGPAGGNYFYYNRGVGLTVWEQYMFTSSALTTNANGKMSLHDSDPKLAHSVCNFAQCGCYHFIHGKFYKCGPVALFPELDAQFGLDLSDSDRQLINAYEPLTVDDYEHRHEQFFADLDQPIPQCKFCPESLNVKKIYPIVKGSK